MGYSTEEDSDGVVRGYDLGTEKWVIASRTKRNKKKKAYSEIGLQCDVASELREHDRPGVCTGGPGTLVCGKPILESSVKCDKCQCEYHPECQMVPVEAMSAVTKFPMLHWFCSSCRLSIFDKAVASEEANVIEKLDSFKEETMRGVKDQIESVRRVVSDHVRLVNEMI